MDYDTLATAVGLVDPPCDYYRIGAVKHLRCLLRLIRIRVRTSLPRQTILLNGRSFGQFPNAKAGLRAVYQADEKWRVQRGEAPLPGFLYTTEVSLSGTLHI